MTVLAILVLVACAGLLVSAWTDNEDTGGVFLALLLPLAAALAIVVLA